MDYQDRDDPVWTCSRWQGWTWTRARDSLHKTLSRDTVIELEPNVKKEGLTGASVYYDCMSIFPERLTLAFIKSGDTTRRSSGELCQGWGFILSNDKRIAGVTVHDTITEEKTECPRRAHGELRRSMGRLILGLRKKGWGRAAAPLGRNSYHYEKARQRPHCGHHYKEGETYFYLCPGADTPYRHHGQGIYRSPDWIPRDGKKHPGIAWWGERCVWLQAVIVQGILHTMEVSGAVEDQTEDVYESSRKYEFMTTRLTGSTGSSPWKEANTRLAGTRRRGFKIISKKLKRKLKRTITR